MGNPDVAWAYEDVEKIAAEGGKLQEYSEQFGREILNRSCKPDLRQIVVRILGRDE